jgi:hypothetical protein
MPRTQLHKRLATLATGSAKTGQNTGALVGKTADLVDRADKVIARIDQLLSKVARLEMLITTGGPVLVARLGTTLDLLDDLLKKAGAGGGGASRPSGGGGGTGGKQTS